MAELSAQEFEELIEHAIDGHTDIVLVAVDRDRDLLARANQSGQRLLDQAASFRAGTRSLTSNATLWAVTTP